MFAIIASGQLVKTDYQQVDETHIVFPLLNVESINHIVVFMTASSLPENLIGAVYFSLPSTDGQLSWQYLGYISNEKPSAIFRISKLKPKTEDIVSDAFCNYGSGGAPANRQDQMALLGISLEPSENVKNMTADERAQTNLASQVVEFTSAMLENFSNYVCSFCVTASEVQSKPPDSYIPVSVFNKWYENMQRRLKVDPYFWKK